MVDDQRAPADAVTSMLPDHDRDGRSLDPLDEAAGAVEDLSLRGCLDRSPTERLRLARGVYERLHPAMSALGLLFLVVVLAQGGTRRGSALHTALVVATWALWATFAAEYTLRLVIAPGRRQFLVKTWWQILFLAVPFLSVFRGILFLRLARPTRVVLAAFRSTRSARATLTSRTTWLGLLTGIVVFSAADLLYHATDFQSYGEALHAAAMAAITGQRTGSDAGLAQVLDVALALYAVVFFASLAAIIGAFLLSEETRDGRRGRSPSRGG